MVSGTREALISNEVRRMAAMACMTKAVPVCAECRVPTEAVHDVIEHCLAAACKNFISWRDDNFLCFTLTCVLSPTLEAVRTVSRDGAVLPRHWRQLGPVLFIALDSALRGRKGSDPVAHTDFVCQKLQQELALAGWTLQFQEYSGDRHDIRT